MVHETEPTSGHDKMYTMYGVDVIPPQKFPPLLREIPQPPQTLWYAGTLPAPNLNLLAVVGSRKYTRYGQQALDSLIDELRGYPIGIVSGLAIGIDTLAHEAALRNNLYTLAMPGSGLDPSVVYPRRNKKLAEQIVSVGGGLLSEYEPLTHATKWTFPQRNRLMAGITHGTLLIEAGERSGTLITARLASDYNREVLAVPGSIFSATSCGTNQFIQLGATPVVRGRDILSVFGIEEQSEQTKKSALQGVELRIVSTLSEPLDIDTLSRRTAVPLETLRPLLMELELRGLVWTDRGHYVAMHQH